MPAIIKGQMTICVATDGADANLLDWVSDWDSGKTVVGGQNLITPKIFAGTKNADETITGIAIGRFPLGVRNISGEVITETVNGIYGFNNGNKTFGINATGSVQIGTGNEYVRYDAATGKVEFGSAVAMAWVGATYIDSGGVFTGSLSADTVSAIRIDASQITAGTVDTARLNVDSLKASLITAANIEALALNVKKGTIGGWEINETTISGGQIKLDRANRRVAVYGALSSPVNGHRVQLYYNNNTDFGFVATNPGGVIIAQLGYTNHIAGWIISASQIYKNSVSLGADGSIYNGTKWRLNNDGSGRLADGNILWDAAGKVTFGASVSLQWKNDIENAKSVNYGYRYYKKIIVNGESGKYYPVIIKGGDQTVKRDILVRRRFSEQASGDWTGGTTYMGGLILLIRANFGGWGGSSYSWDIYELSEIYSRMFAGAMLCGNQCMFAIYLRGGGSTGAVYHLYSNQPLDSIAYSEPPVPQTAPQIAYDSDLIFSYGVNKAYAPAPRTLTADVENEIRRHRFIALAQDSDTTLKAHPLTYIGPTGIYTGTLTAAQVNAVAINAGSITTGTLKADRLAAGSITAAKLNAADIKANIINTDYINGLSCTFVRGKIGGFTVGSNDMSVGNIGQATGTPLQIRSASSGSGYWYNGGYRPFGVTLTWYQSNNAGHLVFGEVAASGNSPKAGFIGLQMMTWDGNEYFCLSANHNRYGAKEVYNRIAGWAFDNQSIYKNSVYLGADGSIYNGTKWKLHNDGSG